MKLSEIKGEKAIEVFGDLLEPVSNILADEKITNSIKQNENKVTIVKKILKNHPKEIINIMAILDDVPVEKYEVNFATLPMKLLDIFNDEMFTDLFTFQGQSEIEERSGSVTEGTTEEKK